MVPGAAVIETDYVLGVGLGMPVLEDPEVPAGKLRVWAHGVVDSRSRHERHGAEHEPGDECAQELDVSHIPSLRLG